MKHLATVVTAVTFAGTVFTAMACESVKPDSADNETVAVVEASQSTIVDYSEGTWYFTSETTGETLATVSACPSEDSCEVTYNLSDGAWHIKMVTP